MKQSLFHFNLLLFSLMGFMSSTPGYMLKSVHDTGEYLRMLVVFVQFPDDNTPVGDWPVGKPPNYMNNFIDSQIRPNPTQGSITHYFKEMSMGRFNVIGESLYITTPHDAEYYSTLPLRSAQRRYVLYEDIINKINSLINFSEYDNWSGKNWGPDNNIDMISIVHRHIKDEYKDSLNIFYDGIASLGGGHNIQVQNEKLVRRSTWGSGFIVVGDRSGRSRIQTLFIHEFGHYLLGGNQYHINPGTWGIMAAWGARSSVANPFERHRLEWITIDEFELGDPNVQITLGDYVETGDALRVKVPDTSPARYYYLVNHRRKSVFDTPDRTGGKGLFVLEHPDVAPSANFPRMHAADGRWDWSVQDMEDNPWGSGQLPVFQREEVNTKDGYFDIDRISWDYNGQSGNQYIYFHTDPITKTTVRFTRQSGDGKDAFNKGYNEVFSPWSNPRPLKPNGDHVDFAFHITDQHPNGDMSIQLYLHENTLLNAPIPKPQDVRGTYNASTEQATINWHVGDHPSINGYNIYRAVYYEGATLSYEKVNQYFMYPPFTENVDVSGDLPAGVDIYYRYHVVATDTTHFESSVPSEDGWVYVGKIDPSIRETREHSELFYGIILVVALWYYITK